MASFQLIPAIDLIGGRCVRLYQGDFDQVTRYDADPVELARRYQAAGARRIHVVDLDGARTGDPVNLDVIGAIAATGLAVQAGGGIRDRSRLDALLGAGAERAVIGSVAVSDPEAVMGWLRAVGSDRVVLAFDVRLDADGEPRAQTHGWIRASTGSLWPLIDDYLAAGARHFLCTDIARDGTLEGPNLALYEAWAARCPAARLIASGGVRSVADLRALAATGAAGAVSGKALLDGRLGLEELEPFLRDA